jgi:hypothetical protein
VQKTHWHCCRVVVCASGTSLRQILQRSIWSELDGDASITVLIEYLELKVIDAKLEQREHCKFLEDAILSLQQHISHC